MEKVLMKVQLISYTKDARGDLSLTELVAYCARVSNPANQNNTDNSEKLIKYLIDHKHWSPLEMVHATLEIETTRDIARQILRHRSFSFQEFSQRYADPTKMEFDISEARLQDPKNRQNSISDGVDPVVQYGWDTLQRQAVTDALERYKWAIDSGIAKEQARKVLPEGLTASKLYMSGSLRSWIHYIQLRSSNGTQKEHMEIARACAEVITEIFPLAAEFIKKDPL
jgi:thymidylate synthase (FAD)